VLAGLKAWTASDDRVLADLARRFLDRDLFRTTYLPGPPSADLLAEWRARTAEWLVAEGLADPANAEASAALYVVAGSSTLSAYTDHRDAIRIQERDGHVRPLSETAEMTAIGHLAGPVTRHYVCAPKVLVLDPLPAL
jgi:uncharacterized protein